MSLSLCFLNRVMNYSSVILKWMVKAVVLFIAHAGLTQCTRWLHWHLGHPDVALRIFCRPDYPLYGFFERLPFFFETSWGSPQLVYVQQESYRHILKEFPEVQMIFMVSGSDIPIEPIEKLIEIADQKKSYIPRIKNGDGSLHTMLRLMPKRWPNGSDDWHQDWQQDWPIDWRNECMDPDKCKDPVLNPVMPKFQAIQWIHLTSEHARLIAEFPLWKMQCIHAKMQDLYNQHGIRPPIADEYWAITILAQYKITGIDKTLTEQDRACQDSPSPIEWDSFWHPQSIFVSTVDGKDTFEVTSLAKTIEEARLNGALFYRKISSKLI